MTGLRLLNEIMDPATREAVLSSHIFGEVESAPAPSPESQAAYQESRSPKVRTDIPIPAAPYLDRRVREVPNLPEVWSYINSYMLYGRHLGFKANFENLLAERDAKALKLFHDVEQVKIDAAGFMKVRAVWQLFEAERDGNSINPFDPGAESPIRRFKLAARPPADG